MYLPHGGLVRPSSGLPDLWQLLSQIQEALSLQDSEMADRFGLSFSDFSVLKTKKRAPDLIATHSFCDELNISPMRLIRGQIDLKTVQEHFKGNHSYIPEKYRLLSELGLMSLEQILNELGKLKGEVVLQEALKFLQITPDIFKKDQKVNLTITTEVLNYLASTRLNNDDFITLGKNVLGNCIEKETVRKLSDFIEPHKVYESYFQMLNAQTWVYEIEQSSSEAFVFRTKPRQDLADALGLRNYGSPILCSSYREGLLKGILLLMGKFIEPVIEKTHCIHKNDGFCRYKMNFPINEKKRHLQLVQ
ncbi:MAG: hypothetical protein KBD63_04860 [Bacteriovoracaceae bacterium]|nr:hypothetical protein [Bacteriovoracaceae bacterium]